MPIKLGRYNKLFGTIVGGVVAYAIAWVALQFPSIATCTVGPDGTEACAILGFSDTDITAALMLLLASFGTFQAPPNKPPA